MKGIVDDPDVDVGGERRPWWLLRLLRLLWTRTPVLQSLTDYVMVLQDQGQIVGGGGGLHYEVVLEEAKTKKMPRPKSAPACRKHQDFQQKLKVNYNDI